MRVSSRIGLSLVGINMAMGSMAQAVLHPNPGAYCYKAVNPQNIQIVYESVLFPSSEAKSAQVKFVYDPVAATADGGSISENVDIKVKAANPLSPTVLSDANFFPSSSTNSVGSQGILFSRECDGGSIEFKRLRSGYLSANTDHIKADVALTMGCSSATLALNQVVFKPVQCKE